jgi:hypothetical protein
MGIPYVRGVQSGIEAIREGNGTVESLEQACQNELGKLHGRSENSLYNQANHAEYLQGRIRGAQVASTCSYTLE